MARLKKISETKKKKKKKDDVAYTPLTEAQKKEERLKLIRNLKDPNHPAGKYHTPGAPRWSVEKEKKKKKKTA
jgi:hypothetical protein